MNEVEIQFNDSKYGVCLSLSPFGFSVQCIWLLSEKEKDENGTLFPDALLNKNETSELLSNEEFINQLRQKLSGG